MFTYTLNLIKGLAVSAKRVTIGVRKRPITVYWYSDYLAGDNTYAW